MLIKLLNLLGIKATKENLTLKHVFSYIQAKYRKFLLSNGFKSLLDKTGLNYFLGLDRHKQEQIVWRYNYLKTHKQGAICLQNNECPCKCTTSDVILSDSSCDQNCYPEMMSSLDWATFKVKNGIFIDLHRNKVIKYKR